MTIPVDLRRTTLHVPRSAKPAWLRRAGLRKRRNFLALILTVALLGLFPTISRGYTIFKDFVLYDPLWSYTYVNASDKMFPPQDPTYIVFEPPKFDPHVDQLEGRRLLPSCIDGYFAKGAPCHAGSDPPLDVVWTWVNGSDRLIQESMAHIVRTTTPKMPYTSRANTWYFRDHDELRHSIRSVLKFFAGSTTQLHVLTSDFALPIPVMDGDKPIEGTHRLGLVPRWLDPGKASEWQDGTVHLRMKYHSEIFRDYSSSSFNSYGIESQLAKLQGVSENFVYMNDDFFMLANLSAPDFYTSSYGVVLKMQPELLVKSVYQPAASVGGEWGPLEYTNWCLSNRFGSRNRPYVAHAAKSVSMSLLREFSEMWESELAVTASHPFRGMTEGHRDMYALFLFSHSVVERWREGLLWSWVVAKLGGIHDEWLPADTERAWRDLGGQSGEAKVVVMMTKRTTVQEDIVSDNLQAAGHTMSGKTKYTFASGDGYPYNYRNGRGVMSWPSFAWPGQLLCKLDYELCFNKPGIRTASAFFKYIAFEEPSQCGDCVIHALRAASGISGLAAFLPDADRNIYSEEDRSQSPKEDPSTTTTPHLPLGSDWQQCNFTLQNIVQSYGTVNIREWTLRMLERYRFVIGQTPTLFHTITSAAAARIQLARVDQDKNAALLCLNDNIVGLARKADELFISWQERRWDRKADWER